MATEEDDEAAAIARAIAMSQEESAPAPSTSSGAATTTSAAPPPASTGPAPPAQFSDPAFVNQLLEGLPGVDLNDPNIQQMLASLTDPSFSAGGDAQAGGDGSKKPKKEDEKKP